MKSGMIRYCAIELALNPNSITLKEDHKVIRVKRNSLILYLSTAEFFSTI